MTKLLLQGVGAVAACVALYAGFFCVLLALSECDYDPYAKVPVEDSVIDRLEDMGKVDVAVRLCPKF